jgi:hypothetical protein
MAQQFTSRLQLAHHEFTSPSTLGKQDGQRHAQGTLFAPALLPRQLPVFKHGPEDDWTPQRTTPLLH